MSLSPEQKLQKLSEKKTELENQIKEIKKAENRERKKLQDKRCQILGKAIYDSLKKGKPIHLDSVDDIAEFLDPIITRKSDRELFGFLTPHSPQSTDSTKDTNNEVNLTEKEPQSDTPTPRKTTRKSASKSTDTQSQSPTPTSQKNTRKSTSTSTQTEPKLPAPNSQKTTRKSTPKKTDN